MKWSHHISLVVGAGLLLLSCKPANDAGSVRSKYATKFAWSPLDMSIEQIRAKSSAQDVLVAFTADWSIVGGPLYRKVLREDRVVAYLTEQDVEGFIADCTMPDSVGRKAMQTYGVKAYPVSLGIWRRDGTFDFIRLSLTPEGIIAAIETLLKNGTE